MKRSQQVQGWRGTMFLCGVVLRNLASAFPQGIQPPNQHSTTERHKTKATDNRECPQVLQN